MIKTENEELEQSISLRTVLTSLQIGWDKDTRSSFLCSCSTIECVMFRNEDLRETSVDE